MSATTLAHMIATHVHYDVWVSATRHWTISVFHLFTWLAAS